MSSEEEIWRRLVVELRVLEGTADALQSRIRLVNSALTELSVANKTLEGMEKEKEGTSLLVSIGGSSYIKAKMESADALIVGIGANVAVERTIGEAKENVVRRIAELEKTRNALQQQLAQTVSQIQDDRVKLQELAEKLRGKEVP